MKAVAAVRGPSRAKPSRVRRFVHVRTNAQGRAHAHESPRTGDKAHASDNPHA
jgi:hypothetical protein